MVFSHVIEPFPDGCPTFPQLSNTNNKQVVGDIMLQSQMVGMINVLAGLADYTNQVFSSLLKESAAISTRIAAIGEKCVTLTLKVELVERATNISAEAKSANRRTEFHASTHEHMPLFTQATAPPAVRKQYEMCRAAPNLAILDPFNAGQSCMKAYSDPGFFAEQWALSQSRLREEVRQHRAAKMAKRKLEEETQGNESSNNNNVKERHPTNMRVYKYNSHTGEKQVASPGTRHAQRQSVSTLVAPNELIRRDPLPPPNVPRWVNDLPIKESTTFHSEVPKFSNTPTAPRYVPNVVMQPTCGASELPVHNSEIKLPVYEEISYAVSPTPTNVDNPIKPPLPPRPVAPSTVVANPSARSQLLIDIENGIKLRPAPAKVPRVEEEQVPVWFPWPPIHRHPYPFPYDNDDYYDDDDDWDTWSDDHNNNTNYHA